MRSSSAITFDGSEIATRSRPFSSNPIGAALSRRAAWELSRLSAARSILKRVRSTWKSPKRCATARGAAAVRSGQLLDTIDGARERASEISEARGLLVRDARLPLGGISDIAASIERVRKAAALDAPELVAVATTGKSMARVRTHLREHAEVAPKLAARGESLARLTLGAGQGLIELHRQDGAGRNRHIPLQGDRIAHPFA